MRMFSTIFFLLLTFASFGQVIKVGAKHFNESYILGEMLSQLLEDEGYEVERKFNLGGTVVCFEALRTGGIDLYPEYTGSLAEEILKSETRLSLPELNTQLQKELNLEISSSFGFNNTYALAGTPETFAQLQLTKISDLRQYHDLSMALSYEFLKRKDGWENLKQAYNLKLDPVGIEHGLAYQAISNGRIQITDAYSTDGEIEKYGLTLLEDDLGFFPEYYAVAVFQANLPVQVKRIVSKLANQIDEDEMQTMNSEMLYGGKTFDEVARSFLQRKNMASGSKSRVSQGMLKQIATKSIEHLSITGIALGLAVLFAVPLGILLFVFSSVSRPVLYVVGLLQTIPSIALLALMIPLLGIGKIPAVTALFLYALLPILRNTTTGLTSVDPVLRKVATGMGMTVFQQLRYVGIPLAMPAILAGIRTAAVITIGTATLAAFIGAGGLGEFIVTGLALNNTSLILQGAIPAALLAIVVEFVFELVEKISIPRHLRS